MNEETNEPDEGVADEETNEPDEGVADEENKNDVSNLDTHGGSEVA